MPSLFTSQQLVKSYSEESLICNTAGFTRFNLPGFDRNSVAGDKIKKNWQYCAFGVICGYKHAHFWRNRDD